MSRRPTFYETFSILDDHYNFHLKWVDVNGRCNYFVGASYRHHFRAAQQFLILTFFLLFPLYQKWPFKEYQHHSQQKLPFISQHSKEAPLHPNPIDLLQNSSIDQTQEKLCSNSLDCTADQECQDSMCTKKLVGKGPFINDVTQKWYFLPLK